MTFRTPRNEKTRIDIKYLFDPYPWSKINRPPLKSLNIIITSFIVIIIVAIIIFARHTRFSFIRACDLWLSLLLLLYVFLFEKMNVFFICLISLECDEPPTFFVLFFSIAQIDLRLRMFLNMLSMRIYEKQVSRPNEKKTENPIEKNTKTKCHYFCVMTEKVFYTQRLHI